MTTRAQLILERIEILKNDLKLLNLQGYDSFINSDYDICDIVYYLSLQFHPINDKQEIERVIVKKLISMGLEINIKGVENLLDFICWFKRLE